LIVKPKASVGVFGGSGFYSFLEKSDEITMETPYGYPSAPINTSRVNGVTVAFLPRHGKRHELPPHMVPYRANLHAFHQMGVKRVLAPTAVGSLDPRFKPGDFVFTDQFVNFTSGRRDTFYDGPETTHVSTADPYCPELREIGIRVSKRLGLRFHPRGTVVVVQGPRFSTRAESKFFRSQGWEIINMTQYPEVVLARELRMCYANISIVTDYDVGLEGSPGVKPVSHEEVIRVFNDNMGKLRNLILEMIRTLPEKRSCTCGKALAGARVSVH
jgi:5'-methylthioadenosine phosphorylase